FMRKAQENINRMDTLIKDLSILNRFDDGAAVIPTEPVDFHDVVLTVEAETEESGLLHDMKFINGVPEGKIISGNFTLLVAMLHNLVKNAVAYSQGTELGVRLDGEDDRYYHFTFFDNGVGVGEEHLEHLFERFYCVDSGRSRKSCGTGLGLPIVHDTVCFHGGDIYVANGKDRGLEFHFSLCRTDEKITDL
ncbi:MAG: HAMP domain-containing histidine kinase, partial [Muribaculaceae bacterium]|nr:HAMP domain-containing histidine kinase [Muribaculaceae bacterium]